MDASGRRTADDPARASCRGLPPRPSRGDRRERGAPRPRRLARGRRHPLPRGDAGGGLDGLGRVERSRAVHRALRRVRRRRARAGARSRAERARRRSPDRGGWSARRRSQAGGPQRGRRLPTARRRRARSRERLALAAGAPVDRRPLAAGPGTGWPAAPSAASDSWHAASRGPSVSRGRRNTSTACSPAVRAAEPAARASAGRCRRGRTPSPGAPPR